MEYIKPEKWKWTEDEWRGWLIAAVLSFLLLFLYFALIEDYLPEQLRIAGVGIIIAIDYGFWIFGMEYMAIRKNPGDRERVQRFNKLTYVNLWNLAEFGLWLLINIILFALGIKIGDLENFFLIVAIFIVGWLLLYRKYLYHRFWKKQLGRSHL